MRLRHEQDHLKCRLERVQAEVSDCATRLQTFKSVCPLSQRFWSGLESKSDPERCRKSAIS